MADYIAAYVRYLFALIEADPCDPIATKNPPSLAQWRIETGREPLNEEALRVIVKELSE